MNFFIILFFSFGFSRFHFELCPEQIGKLKKVKIRTTYFNIEHKLEWCRWAMYSTSSDFHKHSIGWIVCHHASDAHKTIVYAVHRTKLPKLHHFILQFHLNFHFHSHFHIHLYVCVCVFVCFVGHVHFIQRNIHVL